MDVALPVKQAFHALYEQVRAERREGKGEGAQPV